MEDLNRRMSDVQGEKLIRLEGEVVHVKEAVNTIGTRLEEHITSNARGFEELRDHMQSLAVSAQLANQSNVAQTITLKELSNTLAEMGKNDFKVTTLEDWRTRVDTHLAYCDAKHESTKEKLTKTDEMVRRLYWIIPIAATAIGFVVELIDTFHLIK